MLVAATGVGAGDLATAAFTGNAIGVAVIWAVVLGAFLKFVLNEGLARWQLATGTTLLEGAVDKLGLPFQLLFFAYLIVWSFFVGSALMSACGATAHALIPVFDEARTGKIVFGVVHSLLGVALVRIGGYRLFEKVMALCIAVMFITVVVCAILIRPAWGDAIAVFAHPGMLQLDGKGLVWTMALMGGVGGTLTVLCYGYWIREEGREGTEAVRTCRLDLATGYTMTALFGIAMVAIGSQTAVEGKGSGLVVALASRLEGPLGPVGRWAFLLGAWGAVFSSLLGVWQSVPYVFADFIGMSLREPADARRRRVAPASRTYRVYLYALAIVPMVALAYSFKEVQKYYAVFGAFFMPFLAFVLLYLNGRAKWVGKEHTNRPLTVVVLVFTLLFFGAAVVLEIRNRFLV
ncbi:MAG: divalent metal cation transporter [bacterium]|nr:divalent metal cation transporter [bacterium]